MTEKGYKGGLVSRIRNKNSGKNQITTLQIRNQVLSELGKINEFAANAFLWYEKTKDHGLNSGESE